MKRSAMAAVAGLVPGLLVGPPALVLAHGVLLESRPAARETVAAASRLDLRFNSRIEPVFTHLRLTGLSAEEMRSF